MVVIGCASSPLCTSLQSNLFQNSILVAKTTHSSLETTPDVVCLFLQAHTAAMPDSAAAAYGSTPSSNLPAHGRLPPPPPGPAHPHTSPSATAAALTLSHPHHPHPPHPPPSPYSPSPSPACRLHTTCFHPGMTTCTWLCGLGVFLTRFLKLSYIYPVYVRVDGNYI